MGIANEAGHGLLIRAATVFSDGEVLERHDVRVGSDGYIHALGRGLREQGERLVDGTDSILMPGLIDCHVHVAFDAGPDPFSKRPTTAEAALTAAGNVARTLQAGFTTVRSLGGPAGVEVAVSQAQAARIIPGCRVIPAGQAICMTGGHGWPVMGREVDGPFEARKAAREQIKAGAKVIKLIATGGILTQGVESGSPQLEPDELSAAIQEAHKAGRRTTAHAHGATGIRNAIEAGIDCIEHGIFLDADLTELLIKTKTYLCPTLSGSARLLAHADDQEMPRYIVDKALAVRDVRATNIRQAIAAGAKVALGTDAGTPFNQHGANAFELLMLIQHGMSVTEALTSATAVAADNIGLGDTLGRIKVGYVGDLVMFDAHALSDLSVVTAGPSRVIQAGQLVFEAAKCSVRGRGFGPHLK